MPKQLALCIIGPSGRKRRRRTVSGCIQQACASRAFQAEEAEEEDEELYQEAYITPVVQGTIKGRRRRRTPPGGIEQACASRPFKQKQKKKTMSCTRKHTSGLWPLQNNERKKKKKDSTWKHRAGLCLEGLSRTSCPLMSGSHIPAAAHQWASGLSTGLRPASMGCLPFGLGPQLLLHVCTPSLHAGLHYLSCDRLPKPYNPSATPE